MVAQRAPRREEQLRDVLDAVRSRLADLHVEAEVTGRPKHYWSIYEKMMVRGKEFDEDPRSPRHPRRRRVREGLLRRAGLDPRLVATGAGSLQGLHRDAEVQPLPVAAHDGGGFGRQAGRGADPHARDAPAAREYGVAAHWGYKEQRSPAEDLAWLQQLVDWQQETSDPARVHGEPEGRPSTRTRSTSFTPKGQVVTLPTGATTIDFAYAIHTEIGHRCIGRARQRAARAARLDAELGRLVRDLHEQEHRRGPEPRLVADRADAEGGGRRSGSGSRVSAARRDRETAATSS